MNRVKPQSGFWVGSEITRGRESLRMQGVPGATHGFGARWRQLLPRCLGQCSDCLQALVRDDESLLRQTPISVLYKLVSSMIR